MSTIRDGSLPTINTLIQQRAEQIAGRPLDEVSAPDRAGLIKQTSEALAADSVPPSKVREALLEAWTATNEDRRQAAAAIEASPAMQTYIGPALGRGAQGAQMLAMLGHPVSSSSPLQNGPAGTLGREELRRMARVSAEDLPQWCADRGISIDEGIADRAAVVEAMLPEGRRGLTGGWEQKGEAREPAYFDGNWVAWRRGPLTKAAETAHRENLAKVDIDQLLPLVTDAMERIYDGDPQRLAVIDDVIQRHAANDEAAAILRVGLMDDATSLRHMGQVDPGENDWAWADNHLKLAESSMLTSLLQDLGLPIKNNIDEKEALFVLNGRSKEGIRDLAFRHLWPEEVERLLS